VVEAAIAMEIHNMKASTLPQAIYFPISKKQQYWIYNIA
jgi:hypothetical protein